MSTRILYRTVLPDGYKAFGGQHQYVARCGLEPSMIELVYPHLSQINGCAYCIDLGWSRAAKTGVEQRKLDAVSAWHEMPFYDGREPVALAWAESRTLVTQIHAPDEVYRALTEHVSEKEICDPIWAAATINAFNRLAVAHRMPVSEQT